jgi:hypothetical protein
LAVGRLDDSLCKCRLSVRRNDAGTTKLYVKQFTALLYELIEKIKKARQVAGLKSISRRYGGDRKNYKKLSVINPISNWNMSHTSFE